MALPTLLEVVSCNVELDTPPPTLPYPFTPSTGAARILKSPVTVTRTRQAVHDGEPVPFWWVCAIPYQSPDPWLIVPQFNFHPRLTLTLSTLQRHIMLSPILVASEWRNWYIQAENIIDWLELYLNDTQLLPEPAQNWLTETLYRWIADPKTVVALVLTTSTANCTSENSDR